MLYTKAFNNYAEFQQIFGIREFDGRKTRKNKILLALIKDSTIRKEAIKHRVPYMTTMAAAKASAEGIKALKHNTHLGVKALQDFHADIK